MGINRQLKSLRNALLEKLCDVEDPRVSGRCLHKLEDILMLTFCALLCGVSDYVGIYLFGINRQSWLSKFLDFPNGIPSHDTIRRVMSLIDPQAIENVLRQWAAAYCESKEYKNQQHQHIMLDGKSIRGTEKDVAKGKRPLHLINVFDHEHGIVLAQTKANGSGISELQAALKALDILNLKQVLVSADAGLSSEKMTSKIAEKKGFYVVPIKSNEGKLFNILRSHDGILSGSSKVLKIFHRTEEKKHGRRETRVCRVSYSKKVLKEIQQYRPEVKTVFKIARQRKHKDKRPRYLSDSSGIQTTKQSCYYISNKKLTARSCLEHVRDHWEIENKLHWSLDVAFGEDLAMVRDKRAAQSLSALRKIAYNLFATGPDPLEKLGVKMKVGRLNKMLVAAQDPLYLENLLLNFALLPKSSF